MRNILPIVSYGDICWEILQQINAYEVLDEEHDVTGKMNDIVVFYFESKLAIN